jgi:hypothetical protein
MFHRRAVKVESSPTTPLSPSNPPISIPAAPPSSRASTSGYETGPPSYQTTATFDPRSPPGSRPTDSGYGYANLSPLPPMLHPPYMRYNEGKLEPRLFVGPPVSLDLAIRQRVFQNAIFEAHVQGIRATDTTFGQTASPGQLHGGGYRSLPSHPYQYSHGQRSYTHQNGTSQGEDSRDHVEHQTSVSSYLWPQRDHTQSVPNVRSPDRGVPVSNWVHDPRSDLRGTRSQGIEDGGGAQTSVKQENPPAGASDRSTEESHECSSESKVQIRPTQKKATSSSEVPNVTEQSGATIDSINPFANRANTSSASASAEPESVSPRTITAPSSVASPHESDNRQESKTQPPSKTTVSPNDDVYVLTGVEALQAQRNEELENAFQAFHGLPRRDLHQNNITTVKCEAGEELVEKPVKRERSANTDEMEIC